VQRAFDGVALLSGGRPRVGRKRSWGVHAERPPSTRHAAKLTIETVAFDAGILLVFIASPGVTLTA
jgi:hypothetical protein